MQFINTSKALYCIWIILSFSCEGAYPVLFPAKTIEIYGLKIGPNVYTIVFFWAMFSKFNINFYNFYFIKCNKY